MEKLNQYVLLKCEKVEKNNQGKQELFLFNQETNRGFLVNGLAVDICLALDGKKTYLKTVAEILENKKVHLNKFEKEIKELFNELNAYDLVDVSADQINNQDKIDK